MAVRIIQILVILGLVGLLAAGAVWILGGGLDGFGSAPVTKYLDADLILRSEGTTYTFTIDAPGAVLLVVDMPEDCKQDGSVSISPLFVALRPDPVYEPDEVPEHVIAIPRGGLPATRLELKRAGAYVLRMEPIPMAMGNEGTPSKARVRILRAP